MPVLQLVTNHSTCRLRGPAARMILWVGDAPKTRPLAAEMIHVPSTGEACFAEISAALARATPAGPLPAIVVNSLPNAAFLSTRASGLRSPILVLVGGLGQSPLLFSAPCMWMQHAPASDEQWSAFLRGIEKLEASRVSALDAVLEEFGATYLLSPQEARVVRLAVDGLTNDETSVAMGCSRPTISTYWNRIFRKVGFNGQREVLASLVRNTFHCPTYSEDHSR